MYYYEKETFLYGKQIELRYCYHSAFKKQFELVNKAVYDDVLEELIDTYPFTKDTQQNDENNKRLDSLKNVLDFLKHNPKWLTGSKLDTEEDEKNDHIKQLNPIKEFGFSMLKTDTASIRSVLKNMSFNDMIDHIDRLDDVIQTMYYEDEPWLDKQYDTIEDKFAVCSTVLESTNDYFE